MGRKDEACEAARPSLLSSTSAENGCSSTDEQYDLTESEPSTPVSPRSTSKPAAFSFSLRKSDVLDEETGNASGDSVNSRRTMFGGRLSENGNNAASRRGSLASTRSNQSSENSGDGFLVQMRAARRNRFTLSLTGGQRDDKDEFDDQRSRSATISGGNAAHNNLAKTRRTINRRYGVGDYCLITNHNLESAHHLVNRYGYPEHAGATNEERRGPYIYLLAQVTSVHFGEDAQYYTVRREDTLNEQRADAQYMEPITNLIAIDAARQSATKRPDHEGFDLNPHASTKFIWFKPIQDGCSNCVISGKVWLRKIRHKVQVQVDSCLNGNRPYAISIRFTGINFLVICSIWYLFIDQLRLAFMPHTADFGCAVVSCIVWAVLFLELMLEVFVRPHGYRALIRSDKAYLPSTVRYLNSFHLISEMISLIFFVPEFVCLFSKDRKCGDPFNFSLANSCLMSLYGPDRLHAFFGTSFLCILRLRIFGLVRHWTKMWINNTFVRVKGKNGEWRVLRGKGFLVPQYHRARQRENVVALEESAMQHQSVTTPLMNRNELNATESIIDERKNEFTDDYHLTNASKIGTALFTTNAQRCLLFVFLIGLAPLISVAFKSEGATNQELKNSVQLLQANNLAILGSDDKSCAQLEYIVADWIKANVLETRVDGKKVLHVVSVELEPTRCDFQSDHNGTGILTAIACKDGYLCDENLGRENCEICKANLLTAEDGRPPPLDVIRPSVTIAMQDEKRSSFIDQNGTYTDADFKVSVLYNEEVSVRRTIITIFALQLGMTFFVLLGLSVLRFDAGRLVLGPLRRMLKIVAFYAKNPLSPPPQKDRGSYTNEVKNSFLKQNEAYLYDSDDETTDEQLGTFETEQLINAVTKITDLLRKCWGVAGAGIISSNLARQEGGLTTYFNPTVPGKAVYALFAFAVIDQFQSHLHALKGDIMILINDIAAVLHEEVYRWGYEESGQCNKNLGNAFLMVYRIGAVSEVLEKRDKAENVIFSAKRTTKVRNRKSTRATSINSSHLSGSRGSQGNIASDRYSRSHVDNLDLSSLPGMRAFADRALLGLLKTFAGIHRDKTILNWNDDFRLGAGVGAASINLNFGMDAGWAVEGAVGSSYKIDATYLSPHVNMASRMMSATKQYGVFILLSQSVQKLLSEHAQDKLRHIDTVTVKGSSVQQKIFTYDAKVRSDFFLYSRSESQADLDSERYSPVIWNTDQDLVAMRNHISDEFMDVFNSGREEYLAGNWPSAIRLLMSADKIMFERELEEGYSMKSYLDNFKSLRNLTDDTEENEERLAMGDGPCQRLIAYMEGHSGQAPVGWSGFRPLTSK